MIKTLVQIHESRDDYKIKRTYIRTKGRKTYLVQIVDFVNDFGHQLTVPTYRNLIQYRCLFDNVMLLPFCVKCINNRAYVFTEYKPNIIKHANLQYDPRQVFGALLKCNIALSLIDFNAHYIPLLSQYMDEEQTQLYYDRKQLVPVHNDCSRGNVYVEEKVFILDVDSILLVERRHTYDTFVFNWLLLDQCAALKNTDDIVKYIVRFIATHVLTRLDDYTTVHQFLHDFVIFAKARSKYIDTDHYYANTFHEKAVVVRHKVTSVIDELTKYSMRP